MASEPSFAARYCKISAEYCVLAGGSGTHQGIVEAVTRSVAGSSRLEAWLLTGILQVLPQQQLRPLQHRQPKDVSRRRRRGSIGVLACTDSPVTGAPLQGDANRLPLGTIEAGTARRCRSRLRGGAVKREARASVVSSGVRFSCCAGAFAWSIFPCVRLARLCCPPMPRPHHGYAPHHAPAAAAGTCSTSRQQAAGE